MSERSMCVTEPPIAMIWVHSHSREGSILTRGHFLPDSPDFLSLVSLVPRSVGQVVTAHSPLELFGRLLPICPRCRRGLKGRRFMTAFGADSSVKEGQFFHLAPEKFLRSKLPYSPRSSTPRTPNQISPSTAEAKGPALP